MDDWGEWVEPAHVEPYCFGGRHTVVPWTVEDEEVVDDYGDYDELGVNGKRRVRWWEEIVKVVGDCGKLRCKEKRL